jgi:carboxymethylenebutenolidase
MVHQIVVEPDADHAFFNDAGPRYNAAAAADAWEQTQSWMARYLV